MTVPSCDERWIGKSELEMLAELAEQAAADDADHDAIDAERRARRDWINAANRESYRLKRLAGVISLPKNADELEQETQRFMRHTDTAERRHKAGEYRDLMGDLDGTEATDITPAPDCFHDDTAGDECAPADNDNHTME